MKRILSLFLSMVLVLSMISGTIIAEASTSEDVKLVKAMDTTGRNYTEYASELTTVWNNQYMAMVECPSDAQAASLIFNRTGKTTRWEIYPMEGGSVTTGEHTVSFKFFADKGKYDVSSDGTLDLSLDSIVINRGSGVHTTTDFTISSLKPAKWYEFNFYFNLNVSPATVTFTAKNIETGILEINKTINPTWNPVFKNIYMRTHYTPNTGGNMFIKDFCMVSNYGETKAKITSVGSDGSAVIPHSQNKVKFTLDRELPGLTKDHVLVKSRQGGSDITASEITITSDAAAPSDAQWIVEATLSQDLAAWSEYSVAVSADYYAGYKEVSGTSYVPVTDITKDFTTPSAPLDIRAPEFENDGSATTDIVSNIGNTDMTLVYTNTASGGYIKEIKTESISVNGELNDKTISFDDAFVSGDTAKLFVIKGWNNPVPLFEKTWAERYDGTVPEAYEAEATSDALPGEITFGEFDYAGKKMDVNINVGSDAGSVNGVLYIYKRGTTLKDNLIYADYVTTTANGSLKKEITFAPDINDVTGEYTAAFYAEGITLSNDFPIYDSAAAFGGNVIQAAFNAKGKDYDNYYTKLASVWTNSYMGYEKSTSDPTAMNLTYNRADKNMRFVLNPVTDGTKGVHTVNFKLYGEKAKSDGTIDFAEAHIVVNRRDGHTSGDFSLMGLKALTWYDIKFVFDLESSPKTATITATNLSTGLVEYTDSVSTAVSADKFEGKFTNMWMHVNYVAGTTEDMLVKDLQILADYGDMKSAIRYIGENDSVNYNQNEITFKISENNGLTKDNIRVIDSQGNTIKANSITISEDMGEYVVTAVMEKDFASNKTYTLNVDSVGYDEYVEYIGGEFVPVTPSTRAFATPAAPVDITDPVITSDGSSVTFTADVSNTSGRTVDATTILTVVNSDGIMTSVTAYNDSVANNSSETYVNTNAFAAGNKAKYFVIKTFENPVPLFNKTWSVNYDGTVPGAEEIKKTSKAQANKIVLDEYDFNTKFDHDGKKIVVNLNTGKNAVTEGVLYVYSDVLSDGNIVYTDYITTAADGTLSKEISFDASIVSATKEYTVAFYSTAIEGAIEETFNVYKASDFVEYKRANIFENAQKSSTFSGLKQVITGTDDMGNVVNDAWTIFSGDADVSVYNTLKNKEAVYVSLISSVKSLANYDALCDAFERLALVQKNKENNPAPSSPSSNNKNTGSSSVSMSATPSGGSSNGGSSVGGGSVFSDMTGHWGQKYAEALVAKGIVNGYADGSFRGDNSITRAELTKIIVEALDVPENASKGFADVSSSSWYADYVSRAATAGVVNGFEDGSFRPEANVSRQDAVLMIYRAMNLTANLPEGFKFFADEKDIQDYASPAIRCLGDLGIITGSNSKFLPKSNITRAEMAAVICRAIDYMESHMQ